MSGKRFSIKKFVKVSVVALALISGGAMLTNATGNTYVQAKYIRRKPANKNKKRHINKSKRHFIHRRRMTKRNNRIRKHKTVKRVRKARIRHNKRHSTYRIKPTYKSGYKFGHDYGNDLINNPSISASRNKDKAVYLNPNLSNRNYDKGFIRGYVYATPSSYVDRKDSGESRTSLADEAQGIVKAHNKLVHHGYAYKLGFFNTITLNSKEGSNKIKHSKQYKLGVELGQLEL